MRLTLTLAVMFQLPTLLLASEPVYPKEIRAFGELPFQTIPQSQLPAGVNFWTNECTETTQDQEFNGRICHVDLNRDGRDELIVLSRCKHSNQYDIFEQHAGRWVQICVIWSTEIHLLAPRNGYYQIEGRTVGVHGEILSRHLYSFRKPRYHIIRFDEYRHDTYITSHDPRQLDGVLAQNYKNQFDHP